ncbi:MAG: YkgJ family cysteine cluster protein [Pseudomonadota bacterium]
MPESKPSASPVTQIPDLIKDRRQLAGDDSFCFGCHSKLPCFTDCCADINILLTPLDVLQLARRANLTTGAFVQAHTLTPITKDMQLPLKMLRMGDDEYKRCPFVTAEGCGVYEDRPWACRMYPLGMGLPPARAGEEPEPVFFLFEDSFCKGHGEASSWTVTKWRDDQGVPAREEIEQGFRDLVSHPWFIGGTRQLDPKRIEMYDMACYDLDRFRAFIFESSFLNRFVLDEALVQKLESDDVELLKFAFVWLRYALFGEPTMQPRAAAIDARAEARG